MLNIDRQALPYPVIHPPLDQPVPLVVVLHPVLPEHQAQLQDEQVHADESEVEVEENIEDEFVPKTEDEGKDDIVDKVENIVVDGE